MNVFETLGLRLARSIPPEAAHNFTIRMLQLGLSSTYPSTLNGPDLSSTVFGLRFENPIGLAAGFDKSCQVFNSVCKLGPGFVEVGTLTLRPQSGNERPRVFRLKDDNAVINRYGFNNGGLAKGLKRLGARKRRSAILGINIGINKDTPSAFEDYAESVDKAMEIADYITINVSSPNTPGLRDFQKSEQLDHLLNILVEITKNNTHNSRATPLLVKIAPDIDTAMIEEVVDVAISRQIAGLIVSNTTVSRPSSLKSNKISETGGLSGPPLFELSTIKLAQTFLAAQKKIPIIGVGGIDSPETAYSKIRAGADLIQLYTALTYKGPSLFYEINKGLSKLLENDNIPSIAEAVGLDAEYWASKSAEN